MVLGAHYYAPLLVQRQGRCTKDGPLQTYNLHIPLLCPKCLSSGPKALPLRHWLPVTMSVSHTAGPHSWVLSLCPVAALPID